MTLPGARERGDVDPSLGDNRDVHRTMELVFALADDVHSGVASIQPRLSRHQLEKVNDILVRSLHKVGLLPGAASGITPRVDDIFLQDACTELWARLATDCDAPAAWVTLVIRILFALCSMYGAGLNKVQCMVHVWRIVAQPAEEQCSGLGQAIMRISFESTFSDDPKKNGENDGGNLKLLMEWVIFTLERDGNLPPPSASSKLIVLHGGAKAMVVPSQSGMRLTIDLASQTLAMLGTHRGLDLDGGVRELEAWRWHLHHEVVRLLRGCRLEGVQERLIVTIAGPLYLGWSDLAALEDIWCFIASTEDHNLDLRLALLCILAEDIIHFVHFLSLPAQHVQEFWDLIYLGMSSKSHLSRRRGLHILQKVLSLALADDDKYDDDLESDHSYKGLKAEPSSQSSRVPTSSQYRDTTPHWKRLLCRDALLQWKDYAKVMEVLEMETEMHLVDQVVPTVERLCAKLRANACYTQSPPSATEFRWIAIPLGLLVTTGTIARRRSLISRIVTGDLGLWKCNSNATDDDDNEDHQECALSKVDEAWVAQVLLPALDQVGWHSSTCKAVLQAFSRSVTEFLRSFVKTLSVPRMTTFLKFLLKAIRERTIGSTGALFSLLAALNLGGTKIPAMGPNELLQLKEMLVAILPPLNQAKRILLLDGVVQILEAFTDYENPALFQSMAGFEAYDGPQKNCVMLMDMFMEVFSAFPADIVSSHTRRYLPQLMSWVSNFYSGRCGLSVAQGSEEHVLWSVEFKRRLEAYLKRRGWRNRRWTSETGRLGCSLVKESAEERNMCLLGLVLSEGFASKDERGQVLADGLSPLVKVLRQCWNEPYVAAETVQVALNLFSAWVKVTSGGADDEIRRWRRRPLEASINDVTTYVAARLTSMIDAAQRRFENDGTLPVVDGGDAHVLLRALEAVMTCASCISENVSIQPTLGTGLSPVFHPNILGLRETCVSLLTRCGMCSVAPAAHMLAVASLAVVVRASAGLEDAYRLEGENNELCYFDGIDGSFPLPRAGDVHVVRSLVENNVEGRVISLSGDGDGQRSMRQGLESGWCDISKRHEQRKWTCLSGLLPAVLVQSKMSNPMDSSDTIAPELQVSSVDPAVFEALLEGIRTSSREEMPMAISCFRSAFPWYVESLPQDQRSTEFTRVFELVWGATMEVRRPQFTLLRDLVFVVLHPVHLAMPELCSNPAASDQAAESCIVSAFKVIVKFGLANRPNVLRAVVERLIYMWRQSPGYLFYLVTQIMELLLFKECAQAIDNFSNEAKSAAEAPRLMLLLLVEKRIIPNAIDAAAKGHQESRQILRSLIFGLMEMHNSKEFRQAGITDQVIYGRKLRSWQALCILCGYFCDVSLSPSPSNSTDGHVSEIVEAISAWFWPVHGRNALPAVRQLMEVFAVRMCQAYPDLFVPAAIEQLSDVRLPGQVLCSLLIVVGHVLVGKGSLSFPNHRIDLFKACLPWMVGTHVMGRMIAQLICHSLLPEVLGGVKGTHLENLFSFLNTSADMVVMRERQLESFRQTDCGAMCTVEGMLEVHGSGPNGEITPTHMCEILQEMMNDIWNETQQDKIRALEEGRFWIQTTAEVEKGTWFEADEAFSLGVGHIQQKIIPWDKLDLAVDLAKSVSLEHSTAAGRMRQSIVMCATLVDKVPNLAGLSRTCEIFAAWNLLVPDLRVLKSSSFNKISTGAEQWLPIEELREGQLLPWIRRCKKMGYTVIGIEQTNNSVCLTKVKFPKRCVLVLGREHSGLPLPVINEMDLCCQIPQQGVLRSLNAHVSGSIVLWEYTRQMLK